MQRFGKFRYQNQEHTTEVLIEPGAITDTRLAEIEAAFHQAYEREYTYRLNAPVEMVGIHLIASAEVGKLKMVERPLSDTPASAALKGRRDVDYILDGQHQADIYDGDRLEPGMTFAGPAIVENAGTTVVIHPDYRVRIDGYSNLHITPKA
jgi:N-methylhydantoinase A